MLGHPVRSLFPRLLTNCRRSGGAIFLARRPSRLNLIGGGRKLSGGNTHGLNWGPSSGGRNLVAAVLSTGAGVCLAVYLTRSGQDEAPMAVISAKLAEVDDSTKTDQDTQTKETDSGRTLTAVVAEATDLLQKIKDETGCPGITAAVSVDGKLVWHQGLGYADIENRVPCNIDTVLRIASISKSLTMMAISKTVEAGLLDLDKPVQTYVKSFPQKFHGGEKVEMTTSHLVSHLSGIRHYNTDAKNAATTGKSGKDSGTGGETSMKKLLNAQSNEFRSAEYYITDHYENVTDSLALFVNDDLILKPGEKFFYSSYGWNLASAVLEGATNKPFLKTMAGLIQDLGLKNTQPDYHDKIIYKRARSYIKDKNGKLQNAPYVDNSYKWAGGGFLSTTGDLVQFGNILLYSYQYKPEMQKCGLLPGYLRADTVRKMWHPVTHVTGCGSPDVDPYKYYGMGWFVYPERKQHGECREQTFHVLHSGAAVGVSSVVVILPDDDTPSGTDTHPPETTPHPPKGTVVAIIGNMTGVSFVSTGEMIANLFADVNFETEWTR